MIPWEPHLDIRKLQRAIVDGLEDVKAQNVVVFNTEALSPLFERVIIASGTSNRQTKALASSVRETVKKRGLAVLRTEGEDNGEWIIVDCGAAVAHIMQPAIRDYYHLEEIWGAKPVRLKGSGDAGVVRLLPKASEPPAAPSPAASRAPVRQTSTRAAAGSASRKTPAKSAPKGPAARTGGAKTAEAKKAVAKRPAPRKSPTGRPGAKASPAGKPAARKAPAKRPGLGARPAPRKAGAAKSRPR